jgi:hypothetical protein
MLTHHTPHLAETGRQTKHMMLKMQVNTVLLLSFARVQMLGCPAFSC